MTKIDFKTRFAYSNDYEKIFEINETANFHYPKQQISKMLDDQFTFACVAIDDKNSIVGFCIFNLKDPKTLNIIDLIVSPKFYRQGIGTSLIDRIKQKLNEKRINLVHNVSESNLTGQFFLKAMKFKSKLLKGTPEDIIQFRYQKE